jgi:hypothetical protein
MSLVPFDVLLPVDAVATLAELPRDHARAVLKRLSVIARAASMPDDFDVHSAAAAVEGLTVQYRVDVDRRVIAVAPQPVEAAAGAANEPNHRAAWASFEAAARQANELEQLCGRMMATLGRLATAVEQSSTGRSDALAELQREARSARATVAIALLAGVKPVDI